jgi:hypothetical protein
MIGIDSQEHGSERNLKKSSILTRGGGLSLLKGIGMLLERAVGTPLSNRWATKLLFSSGDIAASYHKICQI